MNSEKCDNVQGIFERLKKQKNFIYEIKGKLYFHIGTFMRECSSEEKKKYQKYQEFFRQFDDAYYHEKSKEVIKYLLYDYQLEELSCILDAIGNGERVDKNGDTIELNAMEIWNYSDDEIESIKQQMERFVQADELYNRWLSKQK